MTFHTIIMLKLTCFKAFIYQYISPLSSATALKKKTACFILKPLFHLVSSYSLFWPVDCRDSLLMA